MQKVYISNAVRTPVCVYRGALAGMSEQKLAAMTMLALMKDVPVNPAEIDEIVVGNSKQTSNPSNMARHAQLEAGLPVKIPAYTVQRQSASGLQAVVNGYLTIKSANADLVLAGGAESMSQIPLEIRNARFSFGKDTEIIFDPIGNQLIGAQPVDQYGALSLESISETLAGQYGITQTQVETYLEKNLKKSMRQGTKRHVIPLEVKKKKTVELITKDQHYNEASATALPADGAAMCLLCSEEAREKHELPIAGEILGIAFDADSPSGKGYVAEKVISNVLSKTGLTLNEMDYIEISEFTATQMLATHKFLKKMGMTADEIEAKVNADGGTLVTGLSWGASGAVLLTDLVHRLRQENKNYGMVISPAEGGQTLAVLIKAK